MELFSLILSALSFGVILLSGKTSALPAETSTHQGNSRLPQGPPITFTDAKVSAPVVAPQPPSTDGLFDLNKFKPPAIPDPDVQLGPPSAPDPSLFSAFNKDPDAFRAKYDQWVRENCSGNNTSPPVTDSKFPFACPQISDETGAKVPHSDREKRGIAVNREAAGPSSSTTYNQFVTAAIVSGLDLRSNNLLYTLFAPSDSYLKRHNLSLPIMALKNMDCVRQIVRTHVIQGKRALSVRTEDVALSLFDSPIFLSFREANGVPIVRDNVETHYGIIHIIDGLIDEERLAQTCPELNRFKSSADSSVQHNINLRKVALSDQLLDSQDQELLDAPQIPQNSIQPEAQKVHFSGVSNELPEEILGSPESDVPLELLVNIDNFAHAMKLAWQSDSEEANVISVLQNLGASTFLALLERGQLMSTLASPGPWTIFAPDNDAWQVLPKDTFDFIMRDPVLLTEILSYHIVPLNVTRRHFNNNMKLATLNGNQPVHVNFYTDGWASWYTASGSQILNLDEMASNGVVHVVHSVLFPPHGDLNVTVHSTPALRAATALLESTQNSYLFNDSETLTAFLPMDSPLLNSTLSSLDPSILPSVLERQVVRGTWFVSGLIDGDLLFTLNGQALSVSHDGDCIGINGACIVVRDITLSNGVLHVVDKLF